ncbi:SAM-dependent methyltransferase [Saccharopolyspora sp. CA-218241]|uniref:SAM-dependent methyltransferase n=1 Tax=Saccharopolyspora sp. CA-218241 TaxID=3240027 RepID=UPI003D97EF71
MTTPAKLPGTAASTGAVADPARMYDYVLGGTRHRDADRDAVDRALRADPDAALGAVADREFLRRAVRFCLDEGVDQFLDLGSGLPTAGGVVPTAQAADPRARVLCVDHDPDTAEAARALLSGTAGADALAADLRDPVAVLGAAAELLDLDRPVAVFAVAVLHHIDVPAPSVVAGYREALAPGSLLALTHRTDDEVPPTGPAPWDDAAGPRSRAEVRALFDGFALVPPGVVRPAQWRPAPGRPATVPPELSRSWAGVGRRA